MSWYILNCRQGQEEKIVESCKMHLSDYAMEDAFIFRCERLWKSEGVWKMIEKNMFPGYVFLQSGHPEILSRELTEYRRFLHVMEEHGYLLSVYETEEEHYQTLCGKAHLLKMSYGYKDRTSGISYITEGPLEAFQNRIIKLDWHKRFAQLTIPLSKKQVTVWAGIDIAENLIKSVS